MHTIWDGEEKRSYVSLSEHIGGMRHDLNEMKAAMKDVAAALRQIAVLDEQHKTASSALRRVEEEMRASSADAAKQHVETQKTLSYYKGAIAALSMVTALGFSALSAVGTYAWSTLEVSSAHTKLDTIITPSDVMRAIAEYRNAQKGMNP